MPQKNRHLTKIVGSSLLIVGNCVGAGILALPIVTGLGGLIPSLSMLVLSWLIMFVTSLFILEVNLSLYQGASFITMASKTLGRWGKVSSWILWSFLFYTLMIAYIIGGQDIFKQLFSHFFNYPLSTNQAGVCFTLFFGTFIYLGTQIIDYINRYLMLGFFVTYTFLIFMGSRYINTEFLFHKNWAYMFLSLPVLVLSFGYHNIIPTLVHYFDNRVDVLKKTLFYGSLITFLIYFIFELVILGIIPLEGVMSINSALKKGLSATDVLFYMLENPFFSLAASFFALFALVTSFLATGLSFVHLLNDAFKVKPKNSLKRLLMVFLVVLPPLLIALNNPSLFLKILNYAGGIGAILIQCIIPILMVWKLRYVLKESQQEIVKGGKWVLILTGILSLFVLGLTFFVH